MASWTVEVDTGAGFTSYTRLDHDFNLPLNQMGTAHVRVFAGASEPAEGDEIKIWWDKGGGNERLWFRGVITHKEKDDLTKILELRCHDDAWPLFQSQLGNRRDYGSATPHSIIQSAGSPKGLLYNAQGTLVVAYGTTAPNAITGGSPGNALTFRAHSSGCLFNIARLVEQATHGGGPSYGLEWFVDRDGGGARRFNLVTRRERAAVYTAEEFEIGVDIFRVRRQTERETDFDRVKVIGEGSGSERVESAWVGAGSREYVYVDKSITNATTAGNLANRILNSLNQGGTPRFEVVTYRHALTTGVGDDVDLVPLGGGGATTYRCFGISYSSRASAFSLELGRSRGFVTTYLRDVGRAVDGLGAHTQATDLKPAQSQGAGLSGTGPALDTTIPKGAAPGAAGAVTDIASVSLDSSYVDANGYWVVFIVEADDTAGGTFPYAIRWTVDVDGTDVAIQSQFQQRDGQPLKFYGFFPWALGAAVTATLRAQNMSDSGGADARAKQNKCSFTIYPVPRFRLNA